MKISTDDEAQMARIAWQLLTMCPKPVKSTGKTENFSVRSAAAAVNKKTPAERPKRTRDRQVSDKQVSED
jgi:hypothetical protein